MTTNRKIAKISALLMLIGLIGNIFSMLKEMLVARTFGLSVNMDAFYAALTLPAFIGGIITTTLSSIFIPLYTRTSTQERDRVASTVINWTMLIALVFIVPITLLPSFFTKIFFSGLTPESSHLAASLLRQLNWTILLSVLAGLLTGLLNARNNFVLPYCSTMAVTFCTCGTVIYFSRTCGIYTLSYGLLAGMAMQVLLLCRELGRDGFAYAASLDLNHKESGKTLREAGAFLLAMIIGQSNYFISQMVASWLPAGSISAMGYAGKLMQLPMTVFSGAILTAVLPYFSKQVAENNTDGLAYSIARSVRMTAYVFIPFTLLNIIFAEPAIKLLFERGKFDAAASHLTAGTFILYAPQLFFNTAGMILVRVHFAFNDLKVFLKINALTLLINLILSIILTHLVKPPVYGVALATSISFAISFSMVYKNLLLKLPQLDIAYIRNGVVKSAGAGLIAATTAFAAMRIFTNLLPGQILPFAAAGSTALAALLIASHMLQIDEYKSIVKIAKDKLSGL